MRVRIKRDPVYHRRWYVEVKYWWSGWSYKAEAAGDDGKQNALATAYELINPTIIEVFKHLKEKHGEKASN